MISWPRRPRRLPYRRSRPSAATRSCARASWRRPASHRAAIRKVAGSISSTPPLSHATSRRSPRLKAAPSNQQPRLKSFCPRGLELVDRFLLLRRNILMRCRSDGWCRGRSSAGPLHQDIDPFLEDLDVARDLRLFPLDFATVAQIPDGVGVGDGFEFELGGPEVARKLGRIGPRRLSLL